MVLAGAALEVAQEVALHGGGADALAATQATAVDAIQVLLIDHLLEAFAGALEGLNPGNALAKRAAAVETAALAHLQVQDAAAEAPVIMADFAPAPAFVSQPRAAALRARYRPGIPGRYRNRAAGSFYRGNLVLGQPQDDLRIGQIISPKIVLPTWDSGLPPELIKSLSND